MNVLPFPSVSTRGSSLDLDRVALEGSLYFASTRRRVALFSLLPSLPPFRRPRNEASLRCRLVSFPRAGDRRRHHRGHFFFVRDSLSSTSFLFLARWPFKEILPVLSPLLPFWSPRDSCFSVVCIFFSCRHSFFTMRRSFFHILQV